MQALIEPEEPSRNVKKERSGKPAGGNLLFQLVAGRHKRGAMVLTPNRDFAEWGDVFGGPVVATALLDRFSASEIVSLLGFGSPLPRLPTPYRR
jgi:hypothetical protein